MTDGAASSTEKPQTTYVQCACASQQYQHHIQRQPAILRTLPRDSIRHSTIESSQHYPTGTMEALLLQYTYSTTLWQVT